LPKAQFYSARTGQVLKSDSFKLNQPLSKLNQPVSVKKKLNIKFKNSVSKKNKSKIPPKVLIWAVGRSRMEKSCIMPPKHWRPSKVMDLNYTEDSPGLEYALQVKAEYQNGWSIFKKQAQKQRHLFKKLLSITECSKS